MGPKIAPNLEFLEGAVGTWRNYDVGVNGLELVGRARSAKHIEAILRIPTRERTYSALTKPKSTPSSKQPPKSLAKVIIPTPTRFSCRLAAPRTSTNTTTSEEYSSDGEHTMSTDLKKLIAQAPTPAELLHRAQEKNSPLGNACLPPKHASFDSGLVRTIGTKRKLQLNLPANFCDLKVGPPSIIPDMRQLHFLLAKEFLQKHKTTSILDESVAYCIESLQGMLTAQERVVSLDAKLEAAKMVEKVLKEKAEGDSKMIKTLKKRNKELTAYAKKKKEEALDAAGYYTFKTQSEIMQEFKDGNTTHWTLDEDIKKFKENFAETMPPGAEDGFSLDKLDMGANAN
ncbi:Zinc finger CCHC domain-containing protein 4 [Bienertia sinuspersici]